MTYQEIITKVAEELNLPTEIVSPAYRAFFTFVKNKIQELPLKEVDEEGFSQLKTNFNIPSLGKLSCNQERWLGVKKKYKYINSIRRSNK